MPDRTYDHVLAFALTHPWAVQREMLSVLAGILAQRIAGQPADPTVLAAAVANRKALPQPKRGSVAIIPVYGVLAPRVNLMSEMSGGTTYEQVSAQLRDAVAMPDVRTILLDIDSPGGSVAGATELVRQVLAARTKKPVVAQVQFLGASAAYWLASAATEIVAAPSAQVGAIGIISMHEDITEALAKLGVKRTIISAGDHKADGFMGSPLTEEAQARAQASVDEAYRRFVADVALGRGAGVTAKRITQEWKALVYGADEALALGLVDRIASLDDTLARLAGTTPDTGRTAAALTSSPDDTPQEPARVTGQDRRAESALEHAVFELHLQSVNGEAT